MCMLHSIYFLCCAIHSNVARITGSTAGLAAATLASPDPLVNFNWWDDVNRTALQVYIARPTGYVIEDGDPRVGMSFQGLHTLTSATRCRCCCGFAKGSPR